MVNTSCFSCFGGTVLGTASLLAHYDARPPSVESTVYLPTSFQAVLEIREELLKQVPIVLVLGLRLLYAHGYSELKNVLCSSKSKAQSYEPNPLPGSFDMVLLFEQRKML